MIFRIESVSGHNGLHFNRRTQRPEKLQLTSALAVPTEKETPVESLRIDTLDPTLAEQLVEGAELELELKVKAPGVRPAE